ncbi:hypothetical protein BGZ65_009852 [Modicella reniformis]|uniref:Uncharacterized protein n=1 Tax=Modicella reniformis TaxID=1440133 RepID=A0A9P6IT14_9FUNG|nr:hypothetical protein BGZ65_009852 [Modicella reniformis]
MANYRPTKVLSIQNMQPPPRGDVFKPFYDENIKVLESKAMVIRTENQIKQQIRHLTCDFEATLRFFRTIPCDTHLTEETMNTFTNFTMHARATSKDSALKDSALKDGAPKESADTDEEDGKETRHSSMTPLGA